MMPYLWERREGGRAPIPVDRRENVLCLDYVRYLGSATRACCGDSACEKRIFFCFLSRACVEDFGQENGGMID